MEDERVRIVAAGYDRVADRYERLEQHEWPRLRRLRALLAVSELDFEPASFDAIVAFYAIEHVPRDRHAALFGRLHHWLRRDGLLLFSIEAREIHETIGPWLGEPMFFSQFGPDTTLALVRDAGFSVEAADVETQSERGTDIEYVWVRARRGR